MEVSLGWQSPFEAMGPEAVSPTLLAMVQSGEMENIISGLGAAGGIFDSFGLGGVLDRVEGMLDGLGFGSVSDLAASGVGRTGLTKMNSTQVFTGMPPIKINASLLFRAWADPESEVEAPFGSLMSWALPKCLQKDSVLTGLVSGSSGSCSEGGGSAGGLDKLLPSLTPTMVALTYKARTYKPLVIESVGFPMDSPSNASGQYIELLIPVTFATWQTFDAPDWAALRGQGVTQVLPL